MELNKKVLGEVAARLKVPVENLTKSLTNGDNLEFPELKTFDNEEFEEFKKNFGKENFNQGHQAGKRDTVEKFIRKFKAENREKYKGLESVQPDSIESLIEIVINEEKTAGNNQTENEKNKVLNETEKIKKQFENSIKEYENKISDLNKTLKNKILDNEITKAINSLNFEIPANIKSQGDKVISNYLANEKFKLSTLFKGVYESDIENDKPIFKRNGEVITDKLANPEKIENIFADFVKEFNITLNSEHPEGRANEKIAKQKNISNFSGMTKEDLDSYAKEKNIKPLTNEYDAIYLKWKNENKN